jgi:hypothetical protein
MPVDEVNVNVLPPASINNVTINNVDLCMNHCIEYIKI